MLDDPNAPPITANTTAPLSALNLFPALNRETYRVRYGQQAPPFDADHPQKLWRLPEDSSQIAELVRYRYWDLRTGQEHTKTIDRKFAVSVNLPGEYEYESYSDWLARYMRENPTSAYQVRDGAGRMPLSPEVLTTREEAERLRAAVGGEFVQEQQWERGGLFYPPEETRRLFVVLLKGNQLPAWGLRFQEYAHGVGARGEWKEVDGALDFYPAPRHSRPEGLSRKEVPVPQRSLRLGEKVAPGPAGIFVVSRGVPHDAGLFTNEDRAKLDLVLQILQGRA
jgi:hypothetical protein